MESIAKQNSLLVFSSSASGCQVSVTVEFSSEGRFLRWSKMTRRDKDNDVSAGGLNEQWLLPKLENSTEPTLDFDKKTDYIQLKPQLHFD